MLLLTIMTLCTSCHSGHNVNTSDPAQVKKIEDALNLKFPNTAVWIGAYADYVPSGLVYFYCCVKMSNEDLAIAFPENKFAWRTDTATVFNSNATQRKNKKWFNPDAIEMFQSFQVRYPDNKHVLNVLTERNKFNPEEQVLVYIVWWYHR